MFSKLIFLSFFILILCQSTFAQRNINATVVDQQGVLWNQIKAYLYLEEPGSTVISLIDSMEIFDGKLEFKNVHITGVSEIVNSDDFSNYPNPFNQTTNFVYFSNGVDPVIINIYDINGRMIDKIENKVQPKGKNSLTWSGNRLNNGVYIAELRNGQNVKTIKILKNNSAGNFNGNMALKSAKSFVLEEKNAWIEIRGEEAFPYTLGFDNSTEGEINLGNIIVNRKGILNELDTIGSLTTLFNLHKDAAVVYGDTLSVSGDSIRALNALGQWLVHQPEVAEAYYVGLDLIEIYLTNGLRTDIMLIPVDEDGQHLIRGGGGESTGLKKFTITEETKKIDNPGVLVLIPFLKEFYGGYWAKEAMFTGGNSNAPQPSDVTLITGKDVTLSDLKLMDSAGLIILNTHGTADGFKLHLNDDGFNLADTIRFTKYDIRYFILSKNEVPLDKLANGELRISVRYDRGIVCKCIEGIYADLTVTEEYVRNMDIDLSGSVLFANHCFSGWVGDGNTKNNMSQAWLSKGLSTYYGYAYENGFSAAVGNDFCISMEDSLIVNLVQKADSTGEAYLKPDGSIQFELQTIQIKRSEVKKKVMLTEISSDESPYIKVNTPLYFVQYFEDNYQYKDCGEDLIDNRDGKVYKTVCIGEQVWMAENLRYAGAGVCYNNDPDICDTYGRLYSITETTGLNTSSANPSGIQGICPDGWHVPSAAEWDELWNGVGQDILKLRPKTGWPLPNNNTNESGMSLLPGGRFTTSDYASGFEDFGRLGYFWTTNQTSDGQFYNAAIIGVTSFGSKHLVSPPSEVVRYYSCRCVRDK